MQSPNVANLEGYYKVGPRGGWGNRKGLFFLTCLISRHVSKAKWMGVGTEGLTTQMPKTCLWQRGGDVGQPSHKLLELRIERLA